MNRIAVIRIRGKVGVPRDIEDTLRYLLLTRVNHCVVIDNRDTYKGMLQKVKDYVTWGEISQGTLEKMLRKRGRTSGNRRVDDAYFKENSKFKTIADFCNAFMRLEVEIEDVDKLKPIFRLNPAKRATKKSFKLFGGARGYRGEGIDELLERMI
jgi:large subunit ribosomal protein L30